MNDELSQAIGQTEPTLLAETIGQNLERTAATHPDREALVECASGRRWTYRQFDADVNRVAAGLLGAGLSKGDRVGIWAPNCAEWTLVQFATAKVGVILVNINPAYRTHELAYAINQSGLRLLISARAFKSSDYAAMITEVGPDCSGLQRTVFIGDDSWETFLDGGQVIPDASVSEILARLSPDDPINIQYTSGTTGYPKGATLSHRNILNNGFLVTETIALTEQDRMVLPVPFYHCFGSVMGNLGCVAHGATMIIPSQGFEPEATLRAVAEEKATALYGVPTMFIAEQSLPNFADFDLSSLRTGIMAGSPCPVEIMKRCIDDMNMREVSIAYGMTETSPVSTQTRVDDDVERRTATVGRVHPHVEIKIVDPLTRETVPRNTPGELCTHGYSVMLGYWDDAARTAEAVDAEGWMHTGDLAEMRDDGYVNIVGRIKDMIIRGGENVYPREIEEFLYGHPDIVEAQVIGVPDARYGEQLCAWVKIKEGAAVDEATVQEFCRGKLAHFKIPRYVIIVDEFPMTVTGKVRKIDMRATSVQQLGLEGHRPTPPTGTP